MSQTPDPKRDELEDRLVDQALREVLGGEAPPDLSDSDRTRKDELSRTLGCGAAKV